jgi:hypothetical protein
MKMEGNNFQRDNQLETPNKHLPRKNKMSNPSQQLLQLSQGMSKHKQQ